MSNVLKNLSEELASLVEVVDPALVRVEARRRLPASGVVWPEQAGGNGGGLIVTAHHVVEREDQIQIGLSNGETTVAELVGRDPTTDLALLRVGTRSLTAASWADPDTLKVGNLVLALGRPGRTAQATLGVISALGGGWRTRAGGQIDRYLQTDVVMYPGFSGGPLVSAGGQVLGINTSALVRGTSLALPTTTVRRVVEDLLAHGQVRRGYLGVGIQPARLPAALAEQLGQETGLLVVSVEPDSPAERAGIFMGDTLVALDGQALHHHDDLLALLSGDRVGARVPVRLVRGGQVQETEVVVGERK